MPWNDRLHEAAYTSPNGVRLTFDYENIRRAFDKKTSSFEFPDADGTYVQDTGHSGRRYPMRVFFWGDDYDLDAEAFDALLRERGVGTLEHPRYGTLNVVPFGTVTQREDLKTAANQAIIEVTFWETTGIIYPASQSDPASNVLNAVNEYNDAAALEFEDVTSLDSAVEKSSFKATYESLINNVRTGLQSIADVQVDVQKQFNAIDSSINESIDVLISEPLNLAFQTILLIQSPARALADIKARLEAYSNLADSLISDQTAASPGNDSVNSNNYHINDLVASTSVTGSVLSVVNNVFTTKTEALESAEFILNQFDDLTVWRDDNFNSLGEIDTGASYQQLLEAVALTAGFLVEISFTLKQERRLILDRNRTVIDLIAQLYTSDIDENIDFFDKYFELKEQLEEIFKRDVDLVVDKKFKNPVFRESVDRTRTVIYER